MFTSNLFKNPLAFVAPIALFMLGVTLVYLITSDSFARSVGALSYVGFTEDAKTRHCTVPTVSQKKTAQPQMFVTCSGFLE